MLSRLGLQTKPRTGEVGREEPRQEEEVRRKGEVGSKSKVRYEICGRRRKSCNGGLA